MTEPVNNQWLDEMLEFEVWCKCDSRGCQKSVNYNQAKQAILSKLESIEQEAYERGLSHANK